MGQLDSKEKILTFLQKYKYLFFLVLLGLLLMVFPEKEEVSEPLSQNSEEEKTSLQNSLEQVLSKIDGAGKVCVLLTEYTSEEIIFQQDETLSQTSDASDMRKETIILTDKNRDEDGLIRKTIAPVYQGAIVVCQGGDKPAVCLSVVEAVSKATGLSSNQISVLKMK